MPSNRMKIDCIDIENILTSEELKLFPIEKYYKKNILYYKENVSVIIIKSGSAKVVFYEEGEEFILYYLTKNNMYVLESSCMLEFMEESEIYVIDVKTFPEKVQNIDFCNILLGSIVEEVMLERKIINHLVFDCCKERMASFLLDLYEKDQDIYFSLDISMEELSHFIGSKRQTVSTIFNDFLKDNIIEKTEHHNYVIRDMHALKKIVQKTI